VTSFFVIGTTLGAAFSNQLRMRAVVNGHPVQPTEGQLQAIGHPDMTTAEAKEVKNIYHQLMQGNSTNTQYSG
jgi:hypothetical protein